MSYATLGAVYPYLALDLRARGVGGIALVVALVAAPALRIVLGAAWGLAADRAGGSRGVVLLAGSVAVLGVAALLAPLGPGIAVLAAVLLAVGVSGITPLIDAASLRAVDQAAGPYARLRRWGSVGFLLAVLAAGLLREGWTTSGSPAGLPPAPILLGLGLAAAFVLVAAGLPRSLRPPTLPSAAGLARALARPAPMLLLLASAAHFAGIAIFDGFFAVHLDALGHGTGWVGLAVAIGVGVEIVVLSAAGGLVARFGAPTLLLSAMLVNVPRWLFTATLTSPILLVSVQVVHGYAFGAFWVAAVILLARHVPSEVTGGAQGALAAAVGGLGAGVGNLAGSLIVERLPSSALFFVAAGLALGAATLATGSLAAGLGSGSTREAPPRP